MTQLSDDELVGLYCNGNTAAFETLFDRHHVSVFNFSRVLLRDEHEAEEITQETFMALARSARSYEARGTFKPYLMQIARNQCLNRLSSRQVRRRVIAQNGVAVLEVADDEPSPLQQSEFNEHLSRIREALEHLPARQREALALYAFEEMSYDQIAQAMAMPINTVKTLIFRARAELKNKLESQ